jgi:hypothetical protein
MPAGEASSLTSVSLSDVAQGIINVAITDSPAIVVATLAAFELLP